VVEGIADPSTGAGPMGQRGLLGAAMVILGVLLIFRGAVLAVIIGVAMIGAGLGRLWVVAQQRRRR